jgi:hypothetical protein
MGRATDASKWEAISADVRVWNNVNPLGAIGSAWVTPVAARQGSTFQYLDRNNLSVWFCDKVARCRFEPVDLTFVARGGSSIALWNAGEATYPLLNHCVNVWAATGQAAADVFLWHQGEGDAAMPTAEYHVRFRALLAALTTGGVIDQNTLVVVGGVAHVPALRDVNERHLMGLRDRRIAYASSYRLPTYDGVHFTSDALTALGARRYFAAYEFARSR